MIYRIQVPRASPPVRDHLPLGGDGVTVTSRSLERNGVPFIPVSAEVHYSRMPRDSWDDGLRKIAASGVTVIATYALWIHHERDEGDLRFDGVLDVRAFVEASLRHGLEVFLRVGPWAHAEARNGGLPDWLLARDLVVRSNDPAYLVEARRWFRALGEQLGGLPLFAVQVENELYDDAEHLRTLVALARECGIQAPLWTGTAWGGAQLPVDEVLPLYAGYSEAFWIAHDAGFDASSASNFYFSDERDEVGVGADTRDSALEPSNLDPTRYPYATCELGGGMVSAYHRRPTADPRDIAALAHVKLGSGSAWQGYYMFHDGINPGPGLQESHATGARNDLPEYSYDFNAPLGVYGEVRPSLGMLRLQHLALAAFGDRLAALPLTLPADPAMVGDVESLRWSVRGDGERGFVFVNNHQPHASLPTHLALELDVGVRFPPIDVAAGAFFWWPFNFDWNGRRIEWMTAQLVTAIGDLLVVVADGPAQALVDGMVLELERRRVVDGILLLGYDDAHRAQVVEGRLLLSDAIVTSEFIYSQSERPVVERWDGSAFVLVPLSPGVALPATLEWSRSTPWSEPSATRLGPWDRASAPTTWEHAATYTIDLTALPPDSDDVRVLLTIDWLGDIARAVVDGETVDDRYYTGRTWNLPVALLRGASSVQVQVLPLRADAPIYLPPWARARLGADPIVGELLSVGVSRVERRPREVAR